MPLAKDDLTGLMVDAAGVPLLIQSDEDGFIDCIFKMENIKRIGDFLHFDMKAIFQGESVGLNAQVFCGIGPGLRINNNGDMAISEGGVYRPAVVLRTLGTLSDRFLNAYLSLCGLASDQPLVFVDEFSLAGIALHQEDIDILAMPVKIKLFGNDADGDNLKRYFESYYNLDVPNGYICWNEKDPGYRVALVSSLSEQQRE
jgi:hypothetical protein